MSPPSLPPPGGAAISSAAQERQQKPSLLHIPPGQRPSEECRDTSAFASSHKPGFQQPRRLLATGAAEPEGPPPSKPVHQAAAAPKASDRPVETRTIVETLAAAVRATDARRAAQKAQHPRPAQRQAKSNPQAAASEATAASSPLLASAGPHTTPASAGLCSAPEPPSQVPLALGKPPAQAESQRALSQQQASDTGNSTSATGVDEQRSRMGINPAGVSGNLLAADSAGDSNRTTSPGIPPATAQAHVAAQVAPSPARSAAGAAQANARADPQVGSSAVLLSRPFLPSQSQLGRSGLHGDSRRMGS